MFWNHDESLMTAKMLSNVFIATVIILLSWNKVVIDEWQSTGYGFHASTALS
mgnify:CR=1 FL=1